MGLLSTAVLTKILTLPSAVGVIYVHPDQKRINIRYILIHNFTGGAIDVEIHMVPADEAGAVGTAVIANRICKINLAANETDTAPIKGRDIPAGGYILQDKNDTIQAKASAVDSVNISMFGFKEEI